MIKQPESLTGNSFNRQSQLLLKIGIDVHLASYVFVVQEDGSHPKPAQRMAPEAFLAWIRKKLSEGKWKIVSCYEAGPLGYVLHRQLTAMGVTNYVIRPRKRDDRVKTDPRDALSMVNALDRFCAGNTKALPLVRVPTEAEERIRSETRLRNSLKNDLKGMAQRGRGIALNYGYRLKGEWFGERNWPKRKTELPDWLVKLLEPVREIALFTHKQVFQLTKRIENSSSQPLPKGVGALTAHIVDREVGDWHRFGNRRQVSSYTGLCPSEHSSGGRQSQGSVTKSGNAGLRWALCEMAWRLLVWQPEYRLVKKWGPMLLNARTTGRKKKQVLVALARGFAVDWWRIRTGQTTPEKLGLLMK